MAHACIKTSKSTRNLPVRNTITRKGMPVVQINDEYLCRPHKAPKPRFGPKPRPKPMHIVCDSRKAMIAVKTKQCRSSHPRRKSSYCGTQSIIFSRGRKAWHLALRHETDASRFVEVASACARRQLCDFRHTSVGEIRQENSRTSVGR
jgi:hypothetical protein